MTDPAYNADYGRRYTEAMEAIRRAAVTVVSEAESVHYMGRMECSVEAINVLRSALTAARYFPDVTQNDGPGGEP